MNKSNYKFDHIGNLDLLKRHKTAFLASKNGRDLNWTPPHDTVIISGFHSPLERKVFDTTPNPKIMVLAHGIFDVVPPAYEKQINSGKLLILSPFNQHLPNTTRSTAFVRNYIVCELADEIIVGHLTPNGMTDKVLKELAKPFTIL